MPDPAGSGDITPVPGSTSTAGTDTSGAYMVPYTPNANGDEKTVLFLTENTFVDKNIGVKITIPKVTPTLELTDISTGLSMGTPENGVYSPTVNLQGNIVTGSSGWIVGGTNPVADTNVAIGTVNQSTLLNGSTTIADKTTINPTNASQTITITEGYNSARMITVAPVSAGPKGTITSGSGTVTNVSYSYDTTNQRFNISGNADISAPTVSVAGYVSSDPDAAVGGTKNINAGAATVAATVDKIQLESGLQGVVAPVKPTLTREVITTIGVTDAANGDATATAPTSGVYIAIHSNENTGTIIAEPRVHAAGYGDPTTGHYDVEVRDSTTVGASQSDTYYVPITTTTATVNGRHVTYGDGWIAAGTSSVNVGNITSGAGTATISTPTYDTTNEVFTQSATGTIAAPIVNTAGYISTTEGTRNVNSISGSKTLSVARVGVTVTGTTKVTPVINRTAKPAAETWVDAASGAATGTKPTAGAYVQVDAAALSTNLTTVGKVSSDGYATTSHYLTDDATVTSIGANAAATKYIPIKVGAITSGTANITSLTCAYNTSSAEFTVTGNATVSAPTFTEGYISSTVGTKNTNTATVNATLDKIAIQPDLSSNEGTRTPVISKNSNTNIGVAGTATTTRPSSGYYIAVASAANTGTVQATASVTTEGYGTPTFGQYTTTTANLTVGASASSVTYIPLTQTTFANAGTSGTTYTDISATAPILVSGDYLYVNEGYTPAVKISLAKLVPDASDANARAEYILSGYTAYDNDGTLIVGSLQTYTGTYTVV